MSACYFLESIIIMIVIIIVIIIIMFMSGCHLIEKYNNNTNEDNN